MFKFAILFFIGTLFAASFLFLAFWMPLPSSVARDAVGKERAITIEDRTLAYYVSGSGPPVLLIASLGREASDFNELVLKLNRAGYRTIAIEAHGIKGSTLPDQSYDLFDIAADIVAVTRVELVPDAGMHVIGHAFGNRVVRALASRHDDQILSITLIASGGKNAIPDKANTALRAIFDPRRRFSQRKDDIDFAFFAKGNEVPDYWSRGWHTRTAMFQGVAAAQDYSEWGSGGTKPMLILQAGEDEIAPPKDAGLPLAASFPDRAELKIIENSGHALLPEQPEALADEIVTFLARHDANGTN